MIKIFVQSLVSVKALSNCQIPPHHPPSPPKSKSCMKHCRYGRIKKHYITASAEDTREKTDLKNCVYESKDFVVNVLCTVHINIIVTCNLNDIWTQDESSHTKKVVSVSQDVNYMTCISLTSLWYESLCFPCSSQLTFFIQSPTKMCP